MTLNSHLYLELTIHLESFSNYNYVSKVLIFAVLKIWNNEETKRIEMCSSNFS